MTNIAWLFPTLAFLLALSGLLVFSAARDGKKKHHQELDRRYQQAFGEKAFPPELSENTNWLETVGNRIIKDRSSVDNEIKLFLVRAGWKRKSDVSVFYAIQTLLPIASVPLAGYSFFIEGLDQTALNILFIVACAAFLLPKRILAHLANKRCERIAKQTPTMVHLLRVLLGTGLSIEQALRSLAQESKTLLPDLAEEIDYMLKRVEAGDDLSYAMSDTASQLDISSLTDLARILEQTWRMGGSVLKSLAQLSDLIESRMQTELKERVSKLSAKMTVVMMLFLFPALMVFLAAPGFLAILQGLKHAG